MTPEEQALADLHEHKIATWAACAAATRDLDAAKAHHAQVALDAARCVELAKEAWRHADAVQSDAWDAASAASCRLEEARARR